MKKITAVILMILLMSCCMTGCDEKDDNVSKNRAMITSEQEDVKLTEKAGEVTEEIQKTEEKEMEEIFGCKAEKLSASFTEKELTDYYYQTYYKCQQEGYTPVIVAVNELITETIKNNQDKLGGAEAYREAILASDTTNGKELLDNRYQELTENFGMDIFSEEEDFMGEYMDYSEMGNMKKNTFLSVDMAESMGNEAVYLVYVPTQNPWEVFAWLPFGGWNDCPDTLTMMAECRYWYEQYGAIPAYITSDMLMCYLVEPVRDRYVAGDLAKEHCLFCTSILGMGGVMLQTEMILDSKVWMFWWD